MAKSAYIGVDGIARKIKKMYLGIDNKARKVKKGYIGVGGVARPFFSSESVTYLGPVAELDNSAEGAVAAVTGDYSIFASVGDGATTIVEVVSKLFVHSTAPALKYARSSLGVGSVGDYAVFAGGSNTEASSTSQYDRAEVDAYSSQLVKKSVSSLSKARASASSANAGDYLFFANGNSNSSDPPIDAYSTSLVKSTVTALSCSGKYNANGASLQSYALFAGAGYSGAGYLSQYSNIVDAYSSSLVKSTAPTLSSARGVHGASVGEKALFFGGNKSNNEPQTTVDVYSNDLVRTEGPPLSIATPTIGGAAKSGNFLIIPLYSNEKPYSCIAVDVYSDTLVRSTAQIPPTNHGNSAVSLCDYALIFGERYAISGTGPRKIYAYKSND